MATFWIAASLGAAAAVVAIAGPWLRESRLVAAILAAVLLTGAFGAFVMSGGQPQPGAPYAARIEALRRTPPQNLSAPQRLALLETVAQERPDDPDVFRFLGDELERAGRIMEAVQARERVVTLAPSAQAYAAFGASLVALNEGAVTPDARAAFDAALEAEPENVAAHWFIGRAELDGGEADAAIARWADVIAALPESDPRRRSFAVEALRVLSLPRAGPSADGAAPFADAEGDADAMIAAMMARLEARLTEEPDDLAGWLALARARAISGDMEAARETLTQARASHGWDAAHRYFLDFAEEMLTPRNDPAADASVETTEPDEG